MKLRYVSNLPTSEFRRELGDLVFYHQIPFDNGLTIPGWFRVAETLEHLAFPSLDGKRVLDIGPASGYFSFLFEQMGAKVTALEIADPVQFNRYGVNPLLARPHGRPPFNTSAFQTMKQLLSSRVEYVQGSVYDLSTTWHPPYKYDLVFLGSLLVHLRDPIGALCHAASVCSGDVIASTVVWEDNSTSPMMKMARPFVGSIDWWLPNPACLHHWMQAAGLGEVRVGERYLIESGTSRPGADGPATQPVAHRMVRGRVSADPPVRSDHQLA